MVAPSTLTAGVSTVTDLFTYPTLGTLAGASVATTLVVEALKPLPWLRRFSPRAIAFPVAMAVLAMAYAATGQLSLGNLPLLVLNGLLVASAAVGTWHLAADRPSSSSPPM